MPTQIAPTAIPTIAMIGKVTQTGAAPTSGMAMAAEQKPPSTSAPSPPIMIRPIRAGIATARAVRISGAERCSVFWIEKALPKPPRQTLSTKSIGDLPIARRKIEKRNAAIASASAGIATYSELERKRSPSSDWVEAAGVAAAGAASLAVGAPLSMALEPPQYLSDRADDPLEEIVHLIEVGI